MEDSNSVYPWAPPSSAPEQHSQQLPDGTVAAHSAMVASLDYDPMLGGESSLPLGAKTDFSCCESEPGEPFPFTLPDIFYEVSDLLQFAFPGLPLSPADPGATGDTQHTPQPQQTLPSATEYPQCHVKMEGSSAISVVGEGVVAGVNGVVPAMDEGVPMCANSLKTFGCIATSEEETGVPLSAKTGSQVYVGASEGEMEVPTCVSSAETRSQACISASGMLKETEEGGPMSASNAKAGSQAFNYIGASAVLETHGIPAYSHLAPTPHTSPGTPESCSTVTALNIIHNTLGLSNQAGTLNINTKKSRVPGNIALCISNQPGTVKIDPEMTSVPAKATGDTPYLSNQSGTIDNDPQERAVPVTTTVDNLHMSKLSGTVIVDPKEKGVPGKTTGTKNYCGTVALGPQPNTVPSGMSEDTNKAGTSGNVKRRRRRRKQQDEGEDEQQRKVRKYELGPQDNPAEERKRKDALRAWCNREKNKHKKSEITDRLQEVEEEQNRLASEMEQLAREVEGRRAWEMALLSWLKAEHGIVVSPYGAGGHGTRQMSPVQRLVTSPAHPSR